MPIFLLSDELIFPPPSLAQKDGLLAIGGDLSQKRLLLAYQMGIFPWYSEHEPVLWWSPDPRLILYPGKINVSKSLKKIIRKKMFRLTMDMAFGRVIEECARMRSEKRTGTWITRDMIDAYCRLHESGYAHSVETWQGDSLVGGLYGVSLGRCFFGESMYTRVSNASKVALVGLASYLKKLSFEWIDCQITNEHLISLGAETVPREKFLTMLTQALNGPTKRGKWCFNEE